MNTNNYLAQFKKNYTSQYGEDGIIEEVLRRLNINNGVVVDIGAHNGKWYSNTYTLLTRGFTVYAIEKSNKAKDLFELKKEYPSLNPIQITVSTDKNSEGHINNIFKTLGVPTEIDFMSIDVDSIDPWILDDMDRTPKLIAIEIESRYYPLDDKWHNPNGDRKTNPPQNITGFYPIYKIAKKKGYHFIAHTLSNVFFIRNDLIPTLNSPEITSVEELSNFDPVRLSPADKIKWKNYVV